MNDADPAVVEARLRRLDGEALAAFVADLWRARGYETAREGDVVVADRDGSSVTVATLARSRLRSPALPDRSVDVVVAPTGAGGVALPDDAAVLDATDLREMLWYALDVETAAGLCAAHLGARPAALTRPWPDRLADRLRRVRTARPAPSTGGLAFGVGLAALVVLVALGAGGTSLSGVADVPGVAGAPDVPDASGGVTTDATPAAVPTAAGTGAGEPVGTASADMDADAGVTADRLPPGVDKGGVANLTALAAAHRSALAGRSYVVWLDDYRPRDLPGIGNRSRVQLDVDVVVAGERYMAESSLGDDRNRQLLREVYYDGTDWYVSSPVTNATRYRRVPGNATSPLSVPGPFALRDGIVTRYLSTPETNVTGIVVERERRLFRVTGRGTPRHPALDGVANYTVTALVDRRGVVHKLTVEYVDTTAPGSPAVRFEVTYGRFGGATVSAPAWYEREFGGGVPEETAAG